MTQNELDEGRVYPNLNRIQKVSLQIAIDVANYAHEKKLCHVYPEPDSYEEHIKHQVYSTNYNNSLKPNWSNSKLNSKQ